VTEHKPNLKLLWSALKTIRLWILF